MWMDLAVTLSPALAQIEIEIEPRAELNFVKMIINVSIRFDYLDVHKNVN